MKQVEINGQTYGIEWNLYAQLMLERENAAIDGEKTPLLQTSMMVWAALHGGNENFAHGPEWALRACGKDNRKWLELVQATSEEFSEFYELNRDVLQPTDEAPTEGKQ